MLHLSQRKAKTVAGKEDDGMTERSTGQVMTSDRSSTPNARKNPNVVVGMGHLIFAATFHDKRRRKRSKNLKSWYCMLVLVISVTSMSAFLSVRVRNQEKFTQSIAEKHPVPHLNRQQCKEHCDRRIETEGGDRLKISDVLTIAKRKRDEAIQEMNDLYTKKYFDVLFLDANATSIGRTAIRSPHGISRQRFIQKLAFKVRNSQESLRRKEKAIGCNCHGWFQRGARRGLLNDEVPLWATQIDQFFTPSNQTTEKFVWVTAGDESAAGHGNLMNETYTAWIQRYVQPIFRSVGIDFEARNMGMRAMNSAPHAALCNQAIFGVDADVIGWDFPKDSDKLWKREMFARQLGQHPNRASMVEVGVDHQEALSLTAELESDGLAILNMDSEVLGRVRRLIPDVRDMTAADAESLPHLLRDFKCDGEVEGGVPCGQKRFSSSICTNRVGPTVDLPGFKSHALRGHILALFLMDALVDAIELLVNNMSTYAQLKKADRMDQERFRTQAKRSYTRIAEDGNADELDRQVDASLFYNSPALCHTALLPSQARRKGLTSNKLGTATNASFDFGANVEMFSRVSGREHRAHPMRLSYHPMSHSTDCAATPTQFDYPDFWHVTEYDGWSTVTLPNDGEVDEYGYYDRKMSPTGMVVLCFSECLIGMCQDGEEELRWKGLERKEWKMIVNGHPVTGLRKLTENCGVLKGDESRIMGQYHFHSNHLTKRFDMEIKVVREMGVDPTKPTKNLRISSFIVL